MRTGNGCRRLFALLLAAMVLGRGMPGRAAETDPAEPPAITVPAETSAQTEPTEAAEETLPPETTLPEETEHDEYTRLREDLEALLLQAQTEGGEALAGWLRDLWNGAYDAWDRGWITEEELAELDALGWEIHSLLETEQEPSAFAVSWFGSQQTPMEGNAVASLDSSCGIRFRIFNYTNGQDETGNYITAGGINDNGLAGYFDFRGSSYENTAADGTQVRNFTNTVTDIDGYTANHATVLPKLGADGYPVFDGARDGGPQKSLGYLFGAGGRGVTGYVPENTPLRRNGQGQYYYNSADNAVDFDTETNRFLVRSYRERGKTTAGQGSGQYYDFFPFTYWDGTTVEQADSSGWYNYDNTKEVDYWFGMTMEASFSMPAGGLVGEDAMVFEFSGDDDVWVFLDGVLVLDLGGTHGVVSGSINFATGEVKQYLDWGGAGEDSQETSYPTTLRARFDAAGETPKGGWNADIFADYTEHTIKFFYLERATSCANCKILFNMPILPTGTLTVEKQLEGEQTALASGEEYGFALLRKTDTGTDAAAGIPFDRLLADTGTVVETGVTDGAGGFRLKAGEQARFDLTAGKLWLVRETDTGAYAEAAGCALNAELQPLATETGSFSVTPEAPVKAVFTNRLKTTDLTVRKLVAGNMGDRDLAFSFRARLYTAQPGLGGTFLSFPEQTGCEVVSEEAVFQLKHGQSLSLTGIPVGAWVSITEAVSGGYKTEWETETDSGEGTTALVSELTEPAQVLFRNTREVLIDTGAAQEAEPFVLMAMAGGLPLLRRRGKRE